MMRVWVDCAGSRSRFGQAKGQPGFNCRAFGDLARDIRINTGYARASHEFHVLARQVLTHNGDIDPTLPGVLTVRLEPMPTARSTAAIAELSST